MPEISHLGSEEIELIREAVSKLRTEETLKPGRWSVTPLNRDPDIVGMPKSVGIRDISLRTIAQSPSTWVTPEQRRMLIEALAATGVKHYQMSWSIFNYGVSIAEEVAYVKELAPGAETSVFGGTIATAQELADAGVDLFTVYAPSIWQFNYIYGANGRAILRAARRGENWRETVRYPTSEQEHFDYIAQDAAKAQSMGMKAAIFASMLHYATPEYIRKFAKMGNDIGADEIGYGDGASAVTPEVWAHIIRITKEEAPNTRVVMHTHNAFGLGGASALAGIRAGADMVEVAANHVCSGTGQADLAEVVAALEVLYGVDTGINIDRLTPLARLVEDITGVDLALNHPITGKLAYTYATEAIREEENYAPVHKPVNPQIFGNKAIWMLGPLSATSGQAYVGELLEANGITLPEDKLNDVYMKLRSMMYLRRRTLNDDELLDAARTYLID